MEDNRVTRCLREQEQMESYRGTLDGHWRQVAELVRPNQNLFQNVMRTEGDRRTQRIFDGTAMLALPKFASAVVSLAFPAAEMWQKLTAGDEKLQENHEVRRYFQDVTDIIWRVRYAPRSGFQQNISEVAMDIGAFGNGVLFIDDVLGKGLRYKSVPLARTYIAEDALGGINRVHRKFEYTAWQALERFGDKCSQAIKTAAEKNPLEKFWFVHCVYPNDQKDAQRKDYKGMAYSSCYIEVGTRTLVEEGGYRSFPYAVGQYDRSPGETYARGPAMNVLPFIETLNEMKKTILRAGQNAVAPPLMLTQDASLSAFNMRANALNYGFLGANGEPLAKPLVTGARVDIGRDMMEDERNAINDAFLVTLFRILVDTPQITATEAMLRAEEKGQLIGPVVSRIQSGIADVVIEREIDVLTAAGVLPEMPRVLQEARGAYKVQYQGPINQAQKAGAGKAILMTIQALAPLAQIDPNVMLAIDTATAAKVVAEANGMPEKTLRSDEEITQMMEDQAQQAQAQQLLAAAPVAAGAAKDFAQAQATATPETKDLNLFG